MAPGLDCNGFMNCHPVAPRSSSLLLTSACFSAVAEPRSLGVDRGRGCLSASLPALADAHSSHLWARCLIRDISTGTRGQGRPLPAGRNGALMLGTGSTTGLSQWGRWEV